jgi:hypothetical protein
VAGVGMDDKQELLIPSRLQHLWQPDQALLGSSSALVGGTGGTRQRCTAACSFSPDRSSTAATACSLCCCSSVDIICADPVVVCRKTQDAAALAAGPGLGAAPDHRRNAATPAPLPTLQRDLPCVPCLCCTPGRCSLA